MASIDPTTWPTRVAQISTIIRQRLPGPGSTVLVLDLIYDLYEEVGLPRSDDQQGFKAKLDGAALAGEAEYLVCDAIRAMESDGEVRITSAGGGHEAKYAGHLARHLGWEGNHSFQVPGEIAGSVRLQARHSGQWQLAPQTIWVNVDRLTNQAWQAYTAGLDVAAAVAARVAVEEAVRGALDHLGDPQPDLGAALRESHLFATHLKVPRNFKPLDRSATVAALSAIRDRGNQAAHDGVVDHQLLQDSLMRLLPQALTSLSTAVANTPKAAS